MLLILFWITKYENLQYPKVQSNILNLEFYGLSFDLYDPKYKFSTHDGNLMILYRVVAYS